MVNPLINCQDTNEVVQTYQEYLKTKHWRKFKRNYKRQNVYICNLCEENKKVLDLHHLTYKNVGNESHGDVMYLCRECHKTVHSWEKDMNKEEITKTLTNKKIKINTIPTKKVSHTRNINDSGRKQKEIYLHKYIRSNIKHMPVCMINEIYSFLTSKKEKQTKQDNKTNKTLTPKKFKEITERKKESVKQTKTTDKYGIVTT